MYPLLPNLLKCENKNRISYSNCFEASKRKISFYGRKRAVIVPSRTNRESSTTRGCSDMTTLRANGQSYTCPFQNTTLEMGIKSKPTYNSDGPSENICRDDTGAVPRIPFVRYKKLWYSPRIQKKLNGNDLRAVVDGGIILWGKGDQKVEVI